MWARHRPAGRDGEDASGERLPEPNLRPLGRVRTAYDDPAVAPEASMAAAKPVDLPGDGSEDVAMKDSAFMQWAFVESAP